MEQLADVDNTWMVEIRHSRARRIWFMERTAAMYDSMSSKILGGED
jgi:hypothetical protein